ncbi:MAG TPA: HlyD family efflux transporter periplasmic adaptor subunit [Terriglobales bacterium]|nr:HlyD family efflux transporter periplasmic adaptor subunit [Terriglobales bacterium]
MKSSKRWLQIVVVILVAAGVYYGVRTFRNRALEPKVPTVSARRGLFQVTVAVRGSLTPAHSVDIHAPDIGGLIISWLAPNGSTVQKGDIVARFDSGTAKNDLISKTASLNQAKAQLDQVKATAKITDQQDTLDLAQANTTVATAQLAYSKAAILSQIAGDEAKLQLGMAEEKLKVEQATIKSHQTSNAAKIATAERALQKAQADWDRVDTQIKQMDVASPLTGMVAYLNNYSQGRDNAQPFKIGDSVWPNGTIAQIPDMSTLGILAKVSEVVRGQINTGEPVRMSLDSLPEVSVRGKITSISALAEADFGTTWPPPQVFRVNASIERIDPRLRPDMNGSMNVVTQRIPNAIIVPANAVFPVGGKPTVYVQNGTQFKATPVTVLARTSEDAAVEGLQPGARVALQDPTAPKTNP